MKNIHVIKTDKPSRLIIYSALLNNFRLLKEPIQDWKHKINIYITDNSEIKEGDYVVQINFEKTNTQVIKCETEFQTKIANSKDGSFSKNKIILTTDQDLIKDGVQAIDDEFLEWFVKNPSCEEVDVVQMCGSCGSEGKEGDNDCKRSKECNRGYFGEKFKIIIPKEEPKQETTLEEAGEKLYPNRESFLYRFQNIERLAFTAGAKWQQERSYSEEEVKKIAFDFYYDMSHKMGVTENLISENATNVDEWFEQFKNK